MNDITKTLVFLDTETTGIIKDNKNQISSNWDMIQLAYRKVDNGQNVDDNVFSHTDTPIAIGAMATHGIYPSLLLEKSGWKMLSDEQKESFSELFTQNITIAHHIEFDRDVLGKTGINLWERQIDTLKVAKTLWSEGVLINQDGQEPEYVNLQYLRYFFGLYEIQDDEGNTETTTAHDAFGDVVVLERVFYSMFNIIKGHLKVSDDEVLHIMERMTQKEFTLIKTMRIWKYRGKSFEEVAALDRGYLEWICGADFTADIKYTCQVWLGEIEDEKFFK